MPLALRWHSPRRDSVSRRPLLAWVGLPIVRDGPGGGIPGISIGLVDVMTVGTLYERQGVLRALNTAVERARNGDAAICFLCGDAGLGKTSLLACASDLAAGLPSGMAEGVAAESALPFGYLAQALGSLGGLDGMGALDGLSSAEARARLYFRTLDWLRQASASEPIAMFFDDLHWADPDSLDLLRFLCHRLPGAVAVISTLRSRPPGALEVAEDLVARGKSEIHYLAPLSQQASAEVLATAAGRPLSARETRDAVADCAGNPLLLKCRGAGLRDGHEGLDARPGTEAALLISRFGGLSGTALRVAQAASVFGPRFRQQLVAEVAGTSQADAAAAVSELVKAGLARWGPGGNVEFIHPLFAQALYQDLPGPARAPLHARALRGLLAVGADPGEAAAHARAAHLAGDPESVAVLETAGRNALATGAVEGALVNLRAAVELGGASVPWSLVVDLADAEVAAGHPERAEVICRPLASTHGNRECQVEALVILARAGVAAGHPDRAEEDFERAARLAAGDPGMSVKVLLEAGPALAGVTRPARILPWAEKARALPASAARVTRIAADLAWGSAASISGNPAGAEPLSAAMAGGSFDALLTQASSATGTWMAVNAIHLAMMTERYAEADAAFRAGWALAQRLQSPVSIVVVGIAYADVLARRGRLAESFQLTRDIDAANTGLPGIPAISDLAWANLALQRGDPGAAGLACDRFAARYLRGWPDHHPMHWLWVWKLHAELALDAGYSSLAAERAHAMIDLATRLGVIQPCAVPWADTAMSALLRAGQYEEAEALIEHIAQVSVGWPCRWPAAVAETGRAGLAERAGHHRQADDHHQNAVALLDGTDLPLARVRALIDYGAFLRRTGHPQQSHVPLRRAVGEAEACGARRLAIAALAELRACGGRRARGQPTRLTPQQRRVADLAAGGSANAEIAAALNISVRTVEHHLQAAYAKLGIHSRHEIFSKPPIGRPHPAGRPV
jgi:DNA-binding CsgD family transcriptional regulator